MRCIKYLKQNVLYIDNVYLIKIVNKCIWSLNDRIWQYLQKNVKSVAKYIFMIPHTN